MFVCAVSLNFWFSCARSRAEKDFFGCEDCWRVMHAVGMTLVYAIWFLEALIPWVFIVV